MIDNWVYHDGPVNPKPRFVVEYHRHAPENAAVHALIVRIPSRKRNAVMLEILRIAAETIARDPALEQRLGLATGGPPATPGATALPAAAPVPTVAQVPRAAPTPPANAAVAQPSTVATLGASAVPGPSAPTATAAHPPQSPEVPPGADPELTPAAMAMLRHGEDS